MEGVVFIVIFFGGGMLFLLSKSEIGRAIADRIRGNPSNLSADPMLVEEVEHLKGRMVELEERLDFTERMLARQRDAERLMEENRQ